MDLRLRDDVAVVTGGASGIGRAVVESFLSERTRVAICDRDPNAPQLAQELQQSSGVSALGICVDVTNRTKIADAAQRIVEEFGRVDHLVHAAAIGSGKFGFPFWNLKPEDWDGVLDVDVLGAVNVVHTFSKPMRDQAKGTIALLGSVAGQIGSQTDPPYSAAKAALINFTQCAAKDLADYNVRVNCVCPGMVQTPLNRSVWKAWYDQQPAGERCSYEDWANRKIQDVVPLKRWQQPEEIADMIVFLASPRAASVTGQTINVDGGFVMHW